MSESYAGKHLKSWGVGFTAFLDKLFPAYNLLQTSVTFPDVSFYQGDIDWDVLKTRSMGAIIRAGQNLWVDTKFVRNYTEAKRVGLSRGIYWFYDSRISPDEQANILINLLATHGLPEMEIFCDWEYNYGGNYFDLKHAVRFMKLIKERFPSVKVGMYTGYYFFQANSNAVTHASEYAYLKDTPLWLAWYTTNPDYVKIPAPWVSATHWQWTSSGDGAYYGVESKGIDLNYFNGTSVLFKQKYGGTTPDPIPYEVLEIYGTYVHVWRYDNLHKVHVTDIGQRTVTQAAQQIDAELIINGDGWNLNGIGQPNSICVSDGDIIQSDRYGDRPYFMFSKSSPVSITHSWDANYWKDKITSSAYNVISGDRYLVRNGLFNTDISDRTSKDARTAIGITSNNVLYVVVADGNSKIQVGLNFVELAQVFLERGCSTAINLDGGGSTAAWYKDSIANIPNDDGTLVERAVINHVCFWKDAPVTPPEGTGMYKCKVVNNTDERVAPSITAAKTGKTYYPTSEVVDWTTDYYNQVSPHEAWVGTPGGFTAQRYPRTTSPDPKVYVEVTEEVTPPPSGDLPDIPVTIALGDDISYKKQVISVTLKSV